MTSSDYYSRRAAEELGRAETALSERARDAHRELAAMLNERARIAAVQTQHPAA